MTDMDDVLRTLDAARAQLQEAQARLTWSPPVLTDPVVVQVGNSNQTLTLDDTRDYRLVCTEVLTDSLTIRGGRNIVALGVEITRPRGTGTDKATRAACFLTDQAPGAVVHLEGWKVGGTGIHDGIDIQQRNRNTVQLQNFGMTEHHAVDEVGFTDIHPDVVQTWWGPDRLLIDRLSADYRYQGIYLEPDDKPGQYLPSLTDIRNVDLRLAADLDPASKGSKAYWLHTTWPHREINVWVEPHPRVPAAKAVEPASLLAPGAGVTAGRPPQRMVDFDRIGLGYVSPGYR